MGNHINGLFAKAVMAGAIALPLDTLAADSVTPPALDAPPQQMTVREASILLRDAHRTADDFAMLGIANAISSPANVSSGISHVYAGLTRDSCLKMNDYPRLIVDLKTYQEAQSVMIASGHLPPDRAKKALQTQTELLKIISETAPAVAKTCDALGVKLNEYQPP